MLARNLSFDLMPVLPLWAIALIAAALVAMLGAGCAMLHRRNVPRGWIALLGALRIVIVIVFVICLLQPVAGYQRMKQQRPQMLIMVDTSASMARDERLSRAVRALDGATLNEQYDVTYYGFDRSARPTEPSDMQATGDETRLAESIDAAMRHHAAVSDRTPARLLVISDGNDLSRRDATEVARRRGLTVDVIPTGDPADDTARLQLISVQAPPRILLGAEARFAVTVRRSAGGPASATLELADDGKSVTETTVRFEGGQTEDRAVMVHKPSRAGVHPYAVRIKESEADPLTAAVQVADDEHEVLILEDRWRWAFRYLRRILEDDPAYHMSAMLSRTETAYVQFGEPTRRVDLGGYPQGSAEVNWFDIIILGDCDPTRWPPGLAEAIAEGVTRRGKSLVFIAGPGINKLARDPHIGPLLPADVSERTATPIEAAIAVRVADEADASALFAASPESLLPPRAAQLPVMDYVYPMLRKRPGATVLLEAVEHANEYGPLIVMASQRVGRGKTLLLATDTLWKWQTNGPISDNDETLYRRFWHQALRALTPAQDTSGQSVLWLAAERTRVTAGDSAQLSLRLDPPAAGAAFEAFVTRPNGERTPLTPAVSAQSPDTLDAAFRVSEPGAHRVDVTATRSGETIATATLTIEGAPGPSESDDAGVNVASLEALASATGGRVLNLDDSASWHVDDAPQTVTVEQRATIDLWQNFTLLLVLCALLGADWMLRLMRGYV